MLKIPKYEARLTALHFRFRFQERINEIRPVSPHAHFPANFHSALSSLIYPSLPQLHLGFQDIEAVINASDAIRNSKKIIKLMEVILAIGNYMNAENFRGGAFGFTIETLSK
ncbi:hypothetical protein BDK51DRAFT_33340, partial [Blyttiomyces helicus]